MMKTSLSTIVILLSLPVVAAAQASEIRVFRGEGGYLGLLVRDIDEAEVESLRLPRRAGLYVEGVEEGGSAQLAGVRQGDVLKSYDGHSLLSIPHFRRLVLDTSPGRQVTLDLIRDGRPETIVLQVGSQRERPPAFVGTPIVPLPEIGHWGAPRFRHLPERFPHELFSPPVRPRLGISGHTLGSQMAGFLGIPGREGVLVLEVLPESPAQRAGIVAGDVIVAVDGRSVAGLSELSAALSGQRHELEILREGRSLEIAVNLGLSEE